MLSNIDLSLTKIREIKTEFDLNNKVSSLNTKILTLKPKCGQILTFKHQNVVKY